MAEGDVLSFCNLLSPVVNMLRNTTTVSLKEQVLEEKIINAGSMDSDNSKQSGITRTRRAEVDANANTKYYTNACIDGLMSSVDIFQYVGGLPP